MAIMRLVDEAGYADVGPAGRLWYPQLQTSYALASLKKERYTDRPQARIRRNVLISGPRGARKTSSTKTFLRHYANCGPIGPAGSKPRLLNLDSVRFERARGSATAEGKLMPPLITQADFGFSGEMMAWLEQSGDVKSMSNVANVMLEEGEMSVALVKMFGSKIDDDMVDEWLNKYNVRLDPVNCIMEYDVSMTYIACSRPLNAKETGILEETGFLDRLELSEWIASRSAFRGVWSKGPSGGMANLDEISDFNRKMWSLEWGSIPYPTEEIMEQVIGTYDTFYSHVEKEMGLHPTEVRSFRDWSDAAQLVTASAAMRLADQWDPMNDGPAIPELVYTERDALAASTLAEKFFTERYMRWSEKVKSDTKYSQDKRLLLTFIADVDPEGTFKGSEFVEWFSEKAKSVKGIKATSKSAGYDALNRMTDRGWVHQTEEWGVKAIDDGIRMMCRSGWLREDELLT